MKLTRKRLRRAIRRSLFVGILSNLEEVSDADAHLHLSWYIAFGEHGEWLDYGYTDKRKRGMAAGMAAARDYANKLAKLLLKNMGENDE